MDDDRTFPQRASGDVTQPNPTTELTQRRAGPNFFKDGENVQFMRAESVISHDFKANSLRLRVRTTHQTNRTAQTHDSVMHQFIAEPDSFGELHFEISFFTQDIFRVKFAGKTATLGGLTDDPAFPPPEARMLVGKAQNVTTEYRVSGTEISISSPTVELRVESKPFRLLAYRLGSPTPFWKQRLSDLFTSDVIPTSIVSHEGRTATYEAFTLDPAESIYGLGERFDGVSRRGRPVDFVNHDAIGTSNLRSYINVPFFWSTNGYGCFVNSTARTEWDMGMTEAGTVGFCTEEQFMDYFIIEGRTPKDLLKKYTNDLTGTSPLPPIWTFGLWLSRNSYQSWKVVDEVIEKAESLEIPFDDIHLDTAWFKEDWNPDLQFSTERFPDPEKKMAALLKKGIHVSLWQYSFVPPRDDNILFHEATKGDFIGAEILADGTRGPKPYSYPPGTTGWRTDDLVLDFSNPAAAAWYGASAIKTDFGDCIPPNAHYRGVSGHRFQNLYSLVYNACIAHARALADPAGATAQWARSGTAGSQRYPVHWGGDSQCSWSALQGSLRATLSIGLSGFAFFSHDIGGFIGTPSAELYIRWAQLGLLSSHSRSHGAGDENGREPWFFGEQAVGVFRKFAALRYRLLPYIVEQARRGAEAGLPVVRHLILEYPEDRNVWGVETQYLFGHDLLVAPILQPLSEAVTHSVYFPAGIWYDFWSKEKLDSKGEWRELALCPLERMPIWVRSGAMLPWAGRSLRTYNQVGKVEKVEIYGEREGPWTCGDGEVGTIEVAKEEGGKWICKEREGVEVMTFGS